MKYYLCKYIAPRADFLSTMTPHESELMKQHGAFLNDLLEKRTVIAHGPVLDPAGSYGLSLFQVEDDQDVKAMTSADPIVRGGVGHYEIYPMRHLRTRQ